MRYVNHTFQGREYRLCCTADALFTLYEKKGYTDNIVEDLQLAEATPEGWENCCWLYALFAAQGELQRRAMGYEPRTMIAAEDLLRFALPSEVAGIRNAVAEAMQLAFAADIPVTEDEEIDLVLQEREAALKKKQGCGRDRSAYIVSCSRLLGLGVRDALLLTMGEYAEMVDAVTPKNTSGGDLDGLA